jgi:hypothetical protein
MRSRPASKTLLLMALLRITFRADCWPARREKMTESARVDQFRNHPLLEALYGRRSRRFGLGFEMPEGPFRQPAHLRMNSASSADGSAVSM